MERCCPCDEKRRASMSLSELQIVPMWTARCAPAEDIVVSGAPETLKIEPFNHLTTHITVETAKASILISSCSCEDVR